MVKDVCCPSIPTYSFHHQRNNNELKFKNSTITCLTSFLSFVLKSATSFDPVVRPNGSIQCLIVCPSAGPGHRVRIRRLLKV
jgi:hypothetical protein